MSTEYTTRVNDSPRSIATKFYGDRSQAYIIQGANPGMKYVELPIFSSQFLIAGQLLMIPDQVQPAASETPADVREISLFDNTPQSIGADSPDEVTVLIGNIAFKFFSGLNLAFDYDKIANEFSFTAPFDPDRAEYRKAFKPIYQPTAIYIGGELVINGQSAAVPILSSNNNSVNVKGMSKTGNLLKTSLISEFEFDEGSTLQDIVVNVATRFGIAVVIDKEAAEIAAKPFDKRIDFSPSEPVAGKITELVRERGLILSSTYNGRLLLSKARIEGATVQSFVQGQPPMTDFKPSFNPDALHAKYIGYAPDLPTEADSPDSFTLDGVIQPGIIPRIKGVTLNDVDNIGIEDALRGERGRDYGAWIKPTIDVAGWRDRNGDLYRPNTFVTVKAPGAMVYDETVFLVRAVKLKGSENKLSATLNLILPEAFNGKDLSIVI